MGIDKTKNLSIKNRKLPLALGGQLRMIRSQSCWELKASRNLSRELERVQCYPSIEHGREARNDHMLSILKFLTISPCDILADSVAMDVSTRTRSSAVHRSSLPKKCPIRLLYLRRPHTMRGSYLRYTLSEAFLPPCITEVLASSSSCL